MNDTTAPSAVLCPTEHAKVFEYGTDAQVIRAALPALLDDPLYCASPYRPRQTIDLDSIPDKQLYNCIPTVLRWNLKAQASRAADILHQLRRLEAIHGPLVVVVVDFPFSGSLYDPATVEQAVRVVRLVVDLNYSALWKLERARGGRLHLHITTAPAGLLARPLLPIKDRQTVYNLEGHANYLAKPGDARLCRADHDRHPHPHGIVSGVLEYIHARSGGSVDSSDWARVPCLRGWRIGEMERAAVEAGTLDRPKAREKSPRKPKAA
ncbi:hypothetical protein [Deinococcus aerophilus]|nr:hypothetical protein [Deinococcus aerophilus]